MAMAPSLRVGGRIASWFLVGVNGGRDVASRNVLALKHSSRNRGCLLSAYRGQFSAAASNLKGGAAAAAEWEQSADVYFTGKEPVAPKTAEVKDSSAGKPQNKNKATKDASRDGPRARREKEGWKRSVSEEEDESADEKFASHSRDSGESDFDEEDRPSRTPRRKALPEGMRRTRRVGYERNDARRFYDRREEDDKPSEVPALHGEAVYGAGPVRAAIYSRRRDLYVLYVQDYSTTTGSGKRKAQAEINGVVKAAKNLELRVETVSKHVLNMLTDSRPHQGLVLDASPLEMVDISGLERPTKYGGKAPVWVALDEVQDPQNFGAVLRSAYFFGVSGVVVCAKNSAPPTGVVSKASAGALEVIDLLSCKNMMMFLRNSADNGWRVIGTSNTDDSVSLSDLPKNLPTILVLGNEGVGIRPLVKAACTEMVRIPGVVPVRKVRRVPPPQAEKSESGDEDRPQPNLKAVVAYELQKLNSEVELAARPGIVDSLNVSVAAGVLLHELTNSTVEEDKLKLAA